MTSSAVPIPFTTGRAERRRLHGLGVRRADRLAPVAGLLVLERVEEGGELDVSAGRWPPVERDDVRAGRAERLGEPLETDVEDARPLLEERADGRSFGGRSARHPLLLRISWRIAAARRAASSFVSATHTPASSSVFFSRE